MATVVILAWAASVVALLFHQQSVDPFVHILAAAIMTALFGPEVWAKRKNGEPK